LELCKKILIRQRVPYARLPVPDDVSHATADRCQHPADYAAPDAVLFHFSRCPQFCTLLWRRILSEISVVIYRRFFVSRSAKLRKNPNYTVRLPRFFPSPRLNNF